MPPQLESGIEQRSNNSNEFHKVRSAVRAAIQGTQTAKDRFKDNTELIEVMRVKTWEFAAGEFTGETAKRVISIGKVLELEERMAEPFTVMYPELIKAILLFRELTEVNGGIDKSLIERRESTLRLIAATMFASISTVIIDSNNVTFKSESDIQDISVNIFKELIPDGTSILNTSREIVLNALIEGRI